MNLQQLQAFPKDRVRALLGLEPAALSQLLAAVLPELASCVIKPTYANRTDEPESRPFTQPR